MQEIIREQDIINTYDAHQQEQCRLYKQYVQLKQENPTFGYKRIAKLMGQKIGKTRWWHQQKHKPVPIQTAEWLQEKGLLPLTPEHKHLELIARILGTTMGDGGIFGNLNGIFLSSSELAATKMFAYDLSRICGKEMEQNARTIEGGEWGHSWCYQNTNRNLIRFFIALGAPRGDKSETSLIVPEWIHKASEEIQDEFFGALFGNELGVPKIHKEGNRLDLFSFGITGTEQFAENRIVFLREIANYLNKKGITTGKISINDHKKVNRKGKPTKVYRLLISINLENVINFATLTKINYCIYKQRKLIKTIEEFCKIKQKKYQELIARGYRHESALKLLQINEAVFYIIEHEKNFMHLYIPHENEWANDTGPIHCAQPTSI